MRVARSFRPLLIAGICALSITGVTDAQTLSVCGNAVREQGEQCDDGNQDNLDGCNSQCRFEQNQRINELKLQNTATTTCTANRFGSAFTANTLASIQTNQDQSIASGATSIIFTMLGLDDPLGIADPSVDVGIVNGSPVVPAGTSYSGSSDLDWWYGVDPLDIDTSRRAISRLSGSIAGNQLTTSPGSARTILGFFGPTPWRMTSLRVTAAIGTASTPAMASGATPPGHLASENLDPSLTSYGSSGGGITGELCGNITAASLAATPVPAFLSTGPNACVQGYTANHSLLDVLVKGCSVLGGLVTAVISRQPDTHDSTTAAVGSGPPYTFLTNSSHFVSSCRDVGGATVNLTACLDDAAYSSFYKISTGRVIATRSCPLAPGASSNGPVCSGDTVELSAAGPTGIYQWTGPNGFMSSLKNPTIPGATSAASGLYEVTVTVGGCTSPAGATTVTVNTKPATPVISAPSNVSAGQSGVMASVVSHQGSVYAWTITNGSIAAGQGTNQITFTAGDSGSVGVAVVETAANCASGQATSSILIGGIAPPLNLMATASGAAVSVVWAAVAGASQYEVERRAANGAVLVGSTGMNSFEDLSAPANAAYLYRVRAVDAAANRSAFSNADLATTMVFTDDPLVSMTVVKAVHVTQLRAAVQAVRSLAGPGSEIFTDAGLTAGFPIKADHFIELRTKLNAARMTLALPPVVFTEPISVGATMIKAVHVQELRTGVK